MSRQIVFLYFICNITIHIKWRHSDFFFRRISIVQNDVEKLIKKLYRDMANMQNKVSYFVIFFFAIIGKICYNIMLM